MKSLCSTFHNLKNNPKSIISMINAANKGSTSSDKDSSDEESVVVSNSNSQELVQAEAAQQDPVVNNQPIEQEE